MRSLEDHLSPHELASLPDSPETLASGEHAQQDLSQHLQQCEACSSLAQSYWSLRHLRAPGVSAASASCPPQDAWLEFAAGLSTEEAAVLLAHAATCSHCSATLKEAMQLMAADQFDESEAAAAMPGLASATPAWQRHLVAQMMSASAGSHKPERADMMHKLSFWQKLQSRPIWLMAPAATVGLCAVVFAGIALWRVVHPSDARLLALAYNKQRTLELRIPGAEPVALASGTRGGDSTHGLNDPSELLQLRLRAQQHLDETPNSAYWHQVMGEVALLKPDGKEALRNLVVAQNRDPNLPNLQSDFAAAWFELGDYGKAEDFYSKQLDGHDVDPALLHYNLALCWERLSDNDTALAELRLALPLEHSPAWRKTIEAEIARLSNRSATKADDEYEVALAEATAKLLPQWSKSVEARATISKTAALGLQHNDHWLQDWIGAPHTAVASDADRLLAAAITDAPAAKYDASLSEAQQAIALYRRSGDHPGQIRAEQAELYAYQRLGRVRECLESAARLQADPAIKAYAVLQVQTLSDQGACQYRSGNFLADVRNQSHAKAISENASLNLSKMLSILGLGETLQDIGMETSAWQQYVSAMKICADTGCPSARKYSLLYLMSTCAQEIGQTHLARDLMRTAVTYANNPIKQANAIESLAILEGRTGNYSASDKGFDRAINIEQTGSGIAQHKLYIALWQSDRAEMLMHRGDAGSALKLLQASKPEVLKSDYGPGRIHYFDQLARAKLNIGDNQLALQNALASVAEAEGSLDTLHSTLEREQWARKNSSVYETLIQVYLARGENTAALREWEHLRSAPYSRIAPKLGSESHSQENISDPVIVIARVNESYVGWLATGLPLQAQRVVVLGNSDKLYRDATNFYRLCADKNSGVADLRDVGARLYNALLAPLLSQVDAAHIVKIDLDPSLEILPLPALSKPDGGWLADSTQITVLPPWWSLETNPNTTEPFATSDLHMVILSGFEGAQNSPSETAEIAQLFPRATSIDGETGTPASIMRALATAEIVHFSGHAMSDSGVHLLLASSGSESHPDLTAEMFQTTHLPLNRLAVLAACNTIAADPDQVERLPDLRNAMLLAGTQTVVASNWDVDDQATHSLMLTFYERLKQGNHPTPALQAAQHAIRSNAAWQHPYFWAAFQTYRQ